MDNNKMEIKFELAEISNKFLLHLKDTTNFVTHIYYSLEDSNVDLNKPLPTNSIPMKINDNQPMLSINEQKLLTFNWVMAKAFEEFIYGLTKSFKEAYKYLRIYKLSQEPKNSQPKEYYEDELKKIEKEIQDLPFPKFIEKIESIIEQTLPLREEMISINQIRNCLIHRHGVVEEKDVKNSTTDELKLKYTSLVFWTNINGELKEITYELRKDGIKAHQISEVNKEKIFKLGDKVSIDITEFNDIAYTCASFATSLYSLMPIPA